MSENEFVDDLISKEIADLDEFLKESDIKMNFNKFTISFSRGGKVMFSIRRHVPVGVLTSCVELLRKIGEIE